MAHCHSNDHNTDFTDSKDIQYLDNLPEQFARLADAVLVIEDVELPVHQAILAANSPFFGDIFLTASQSSSDKTSCKLHCPLPGDKLSDVLTVLRYCYRACTLFSPSKPRLESAEDACSLARFAHKYDMQALSEACEAFLVSKVQAVETAHDSLDVNSLVAWTMLAEECNMTQLLANCELILARTWDTCLWQHALLCNTDSISRACLLRILRAAQHHMIASEQRMQQMVVNRYNSFHTGARHTCHADLADLLSWQ